MWKSTCVPDLKLSIINTQLAGVTETGYTGSGYYDRFELRISVSAHLIWPLLEPRYSEAERAPYQHALAKNLLHELGHAYHRGFPSKSYIGT